MRYQQIEFKKKINIKLIQDFFKIFPEEKRGRKNFKNKEILNGKFILYNQIIKKALKIKADCLHTISENLTNDEITIIVSYYKKI
jgi:hypothetical protein